MTELKKFTYEQLDETTAEFLRKKESNMREIVGKAYTELGRELNEAQQELRRQGSPEGVFMEWYQSLGFKKDNVSRWINRYKLFAKCEEPTQQLIEELPVTLSYVIAMLTKEEIEAIKERYVKAGKGNPLTSVECLSGMYESLEDIPKLLAEVARIKSKLALIERKAHAPLKSELDYVSVTVCYDIYRYAKEEY